MAVSFRGLQAKRLLGRTQDRIDGLAGAEKEEEQPAAAEDMASIQAMSECATSLAGRRKKAWPWRATEQ